MFFQRQQQSKTQQGFTLIELLVAGVLSVVVILVTWSGLVSAMSMSQAAEARSARQAELNRALDFMTNEIRMARSINATLAPSANSGAPGGASPSPSKAKSDPNESASLTMTSTTASLSDVVTSAGVNLSSLGSYGTLGLYLERPTRSVPAICPAGGPNAGAPPPTPADFDPIVYDIRPSTSGWLQPRMLTRYGRAPDADGTIDPCKSPVSSDPIIDALSTNRQNMPTCSGMLSGDGGFYSCVEGRQANLFFQSDVSKIEVRQVNSTVSSRVHSIQPSSISSSGCGGEANLRSQSGTSPSTILFVNEKTVPVKVYWLNYSGAREYFFGLDPNQSLTQPTFITHPWVVTDSNDVCLDVFVSNAQTSSAILQ